MREPASAPEEVREWLRKISAAVRSAIEDGSRELDVIRVPGG
ncbi:MAG TPA: hypothetical protein VJZ25_00560 [Gemmatimonadaceae bacterium]|nr:hypothetical protein [Gemmatimonadaceae bacterium]